MARYIAIISLGAGSSFYWHNDKIKAAKGVVKQLRQDWSSLYNIPKKRDWKICTVDTDGIPDHADLFWDDFGVHWTETKESPVNTIKWDDPKVGLVEVTA